MLKNVTFRSTLAAVACAMSFSAHAIADSPKQISVPAGDLVLALEMLQKQATIELVFQPDQLRSFHTRGVVGLYEARDAVRILLKGTPLELRTDPTGAMVIVPPNSKASPPTTTGQEGARTRGQGDSSEDRLQLAQTTQGSSPSTAPQDSRSSSPSAREKRSARGSEATSSHNSDEGPIRLEEVVVTAQKREERLKDVPISISVMSGKDLDQSTFKGAADALNLVPGVSAISNVGFGGGSTLLNIRGVGANGANFAGASPVAYYLDSVPFGFVKSAIAPDPNVYDLQQIEVLRGPQGTLYGANAENGVVRVLTNDANLDEFQLKARAAGSSTDGGGGNYGGDMAVNVPVVDGKLAVRAVLDYQKLSGWIRSTVADQLNDAELRNYRLKINAQPTEALSIGLSTWNSRNSYGAPDFSTVDRRTSATIPEPIAADYEIDGLKIGYQSRLFSILSSTSYIHYTNPSTQDLAIYGPFPSIPVYSKFVANTISEEIILHSAATSSWRWTAGAMYRDGTDLQLQTIPGIITDDNKYVSKSHAVFGDIGRRFFHNQLEWLLGFRYFHDDVSELQLAPTSPATANVPLIGKSVSFNPTTPRAVLTWYPTNDLTAYVSFAEGFRSGFPQDPGVLSIDPAFPAVQPEKLYNYEIGIKTDAWDGRLSFDGALYYIRWRNIQESISVPLGNTGIVEAALVNAAAASGPGVEIAVTARPIESLQLGLNFGWNDAKLDADVFSGGVRLLQKGDRTAASSEFTGGVAAGYTVPLGAAGFKGRFSASANYHSKQAGYAIAGPAGLKFYNEAPVIARAELSLISPHRWTSTLFVDNLTNEYKLVTPFQPGTAPDYALRPRPRTIGLHIDYKL